MTELVILFIFLMVLGYFITVNLMVKRMQALMQERNDYMFQAGRYRDLYLAECQKGIDRGYNQSCKDI